MGNVMSEFGSLVGSAGRDIQCNVVPDSATTVIGAIIQYIGQTDNNYINGYFYKNTSNGWVQENVQPSTDVSGKADKVSGATNGNFAALNASGNLTDSGKKLSDLVLKSDVKDVLNSTSTTDPLSAKQGKALADNLAANEKGGAKNHADSSTATTERISNNNGVFTNTVVDSYTGFSMYVQAWTGSTFISNIAHQGIYATGDYSYNIAIPSGTDTLQIIHNGGIYDLRAKFNCDVEGDYIISFRVLGANPSVIGGLSFDKVMLRDARILDPTFAPFAKTNLQLTNDKAERDDLATIHATGSTNTTGAIITNGTFFYLNGQFCKATADIAVNATFTLNTNFKVDSVGSEIEAIDPLATHTSSVNDAPNTFKDGLTIEGTYTGTDYPLNYGLVITIKNTNNRVFQMNLGAGATYIRRSASPTTWGSWYSFTQTIVS